MPSYCCFTCPTYDYSEKTLDQLCPSCSRPFGLPVFSPPSLVGRFRIIRPIARGFYAATYFAEYGALDQPCVLRITSKAIYDFFKKDFAEECKSHARIAKDSEHIVQIRDMFDDTLGFGNVNVDCHIAQLDLAEGKTLTEYLAGSMKLKAQTVAQIGIDLFRIICELEQREINHNDLRADNIIIKELGESRRAEALDAGIRAMVVDLGSVADNSISNETQPRLGDIHWVASHLEDLAQSLINDPEQASDLDYRLASLLDERAHLLSPDVMNQRRPSTDECIRDIWEAFHQTFSPWQEHLKLKRFDDAYNAQTLEPWFVPLLIVDPENQWQARMSALGPQVITGMRGCGKTMLLRSLQLHARATKEERENTEQVVQRLMEDKFVGLYVSCTRLLDYSGANSEELNEPYPRLLVAYALEASRAVRHLKDLSSELVNPQWYRELGRAVGDYLETPRDLANVGSEFELERRLIEIQVSLTRGRETLALKSHPSIAFPHLALAITKCSSLWTGHSIFFLLDDVSTRYINEKQIQELLSKLLFQRPECAFKLTTEAQTLETILRSPGEIEKARLGRDYDVFDLGAEVYQKVKIGRSRGGTAFIESILSRRAKYYPNHPQATSSMVLGDAPLSLIAERIVSSSEGSKLKKESSRVKKAVYHGITALAGVCVGDIGDVISIYELILRKSSGSKLPIAAVIQSGCYQDFCSRRLFDLNRRENKLKDVALSFAEASHELLLESNEQRKRTGKRRLRQYTKIYVRITTGDPDQQFDRLRTLIDSGVFVLAAGSDTPRTKTKDSDPIQQFVLTFRKLFGLSNFIGLSARDRFELSGNDLEEWLLNPSRGKEILKRNLAKEIDDLDEDDISDEEEIWPAPGQQQLFETAVVGDVFTNGSSEPTSERQNYINKRVPDSREISSGELAVINMDEIIVGLGFEDRCLQSVRRLVKLIKAKRGLLIRYTEEGNTREITSLMRLIAEELVIVDYNDILRNGLRISNGNIFVDLSGLAKPVIFHAIRNGLKQSRRVFFCDTRAQIYYPLENHISAVLEADRTRDHYTLLEELSQVLSGETGRYDIERLSTSDADESRRRVLCAFASSKHARLFTLLDERDYDRVEILVPTNQTPRSELARIAADVAVQNYPGSVVTKIDSHDLPGVLQFMTDRYQKYYVNGGFNFELALTGSKIQAAACAAISAAFKISQCWYVHAQSFDVGRFTSGSGATTYYEISI